MLENTLFPVRAWSFPPECELFRCKAGLPLGHAEPQVHFFCVVLFCGVSVTTNNLKNKPVYHYPFSVPVYTIS